MAKLFIAVFVGFLALVVATDRVSAACNPGTPNCVKNSDIKKPTRCGGPTNPCTIDGGFGSQCQGNGVNCGTGIQGKVNVYDPSARNPTSNSPTNNSRTDPYKNYKFR